MVTSLNWCLGYWMNGCWGDRRGLGWQTAQQPEMGGEEAEHRGMRNMGAQTGGHVEGRGDKLQQVGRTWQEVREQCLPAAEYIRLRLVRGWDATRAPWCGQHEAEPQRRASGRAGASEVVGQ